MEKMIELTLGAFLEKVAKDFPDHLAVKYSETDFTRTYKELNEEADLLAKGFLKLGIKKGDHVSIWATNYAEWMLTLFATAKIGAVLVTVNTNYKVIEAEYLLRQSDTKALVMIDGFKDSSYTDIMNTLCPELKTDDANNLNCERLPLLKNILYVGDKENTPEGMIHFSELYQLGKTVSDDELNAVKATLSCNDIINIQYTSGTTGFPKGVMLSHYNILNNGKGIGDRMLFTENDKLCIPVPFFHCFGLVLGIMACITHATAMIPVYYYQPKKVMEVLQNEECTAVHGVPTMFIAMLEHPEFKNYRFMHLRTGIMAGSPCPEKVMQDVIDLMGMKDITIVFGQTESSPGCTQTTVDDPVELRVSTVGRAYENVETKIVDPETGETLGPGKAGEFCTRGYHVMKGYYNMPEATAAAIDKDGWLHTGDLATVDENGYYRITGRIKDMIIRGGENIYPKEIEDFLYSHPSVSDVQVVGVPSVDYGEEVCACIILKEGATCTVDEIKAYVRANMARHKTPAYVLFLDAFPITASGKIQKFILRDQAAKELNLDSEKENEAV
ncbi:MAG: AMP-binding protein [Bacillota bacterium]|nr:AMP-binding protein [Bacillota bacterium]